MFDTIQDGILGTNERDYQYYLFNFFYGLDSAPLAPNSLVPAQKNQKYLSQGNGA
jgi:hypothetical protein